LGIASAQRSSYHFHRRRNKKLDTDPTVTTTTTSQQDLTDSYLERQQTKLAMDQAKPSQDDPIRSRLLNKLGIRKPSDEMRTNADNSKNDNNNDPLTLLRKFGRDSVFRQSLNDSREETNGPSRRPSRKRLVKFDREVMVQPIASHKNYSKRIKNTLWSDSAEIQDNAYRNQAEFAAEGWDYTKALEEEDMYIDAETGELVHPYWIEQQQQQQQQQPNEEIDEQRA
jgi:hypothetical protein